MEYKEGPLLRFMDHSGVGGEGGIFLGVLVRVRCPVLQTLTLLQSKKCLFSHPFSDWDIRFKTCYRRNKSSFLD